MPCSWGEQYSTSRYVLYLCVPACGCGVPCRGSNLSAAFASSQEHTGRLCAAPERLQHSLASRPRPRPRHSHSHSRGAVTGAGAGAGAGGQAGAAAPAGYPMPSEPAPQALAGGSAGAAGWTLFAAASPPWRTFGPSPIPSGRLCYVLHPLRSSPPPLALLAPFHCRSGSCTVHMTGCSLGRSSFHNCVLNMPPAPPMCDGLCRSFQEGAGRWQTPRPRPLCPTSIDPRELSESQRLMGGPGGGGGGGGSSAAAAAAAAAAVARYALTRYTPTLARRPRNLPSHPHSHPPLSTPLCAVHLSFLSSPNPFFFSFCMS